MSYSPEFQQPPRFREVEPIPQWSARIAVDIPYDDFIQTVLATATEAQHRYTGTLTRDPNTGNVTSFTRTRFPRNKYGQPPTTEECRAGMYYLAEKFDTTSEQELLQPDTSRIVLGLYEGQHDTGTRDEPTGSDYSIDDVALRLGEGFYVQPAEVLSVRLHPDGTASHYSEDIAVITLPTSEKQRVYDLGDAMKQERFSVEDFSEQGGTSYMVETPHCKEPDPTTPVGL